jgi:hypothetical protein
MRFWERGETVVHQEVWKGRIWAARPLTVVEDGRHLGWYVNLQQPMRRNPVGFEAMDLMLDVVAEPDLSWRWKDLDELHEVVRREILNRELGELVHQTALGVIGDIEQGRAPFGDPWPHWRPDPSWSTPELAAGWDIVQP